MSIKIVLVFVCAAAGAFCGYSVMLSYKRNFAYLDGVGKMIAELGQNLSYRRDPVEQVLARFVPESPQLKKNIEEFGSYLSGKTDKPVLSRGFLPKASFDCMCELFAGLGGSDEATQSARLAAFKVRVDKLSDEAENKYKKFGALAVKLGFLIGLGVGILIL